MDFLKLLSEALGDTSVIKHEFLLCYQPTENILHAFFEGKTDESFYGTHIRNSKPEDWRLKTYICGNKDGVYFQHQQLGHLHAKEQPLLFFVDKDIEDIIPFPRVTDGNIHVTDYYSIENYIVTGVAIRVVWAEIFKQRSGTPASDAIEEAFSKSLEAFHQLFYKVMAWVLFHRRHNRWPNLDCILTKNLFSLDNDLCFMETIPDIERLYSHLDERTKQKTDIEHFAEIALCETELRRFPAKAIVRGHNEMDFFIEFYKKLKSIVAQASKGPLRLPTDISDNNVIDIMGPRTAIPQSLKAFLDRHLDNQLPLSAAAG
ncbi:DUF4435 domain-containing protein [Pseudomonas aeruginosa]|nr:DUF4435 domain-containing protein [Pseudomonas aeruginosa]MBH3921734.1 DUF4435 domain-containing protein [Pseudomonas aeruginosa]